MTTSPRHLTALLTFAALCIAAPASAEEPDVQHQHSVTLSPFLLLNPVVKVNAERRLLDKLGVAASLQVGQITVESTLNGETSETAFTTFGGGVSPRYYLLGSFIHGMQLGGELGYTYVGADDVGDTGISGVGQGVNLGAFLGYKIAANIGFTFELQAGVQYLIATASAEDDASGESASASENAILPLVNLNVGWSF